MDDNSLLMIVLAFVLGYMASGMMKQMCGGRLVEGMFNRIMHPLGGKGIMKLNEGPCTFNAECETGYCDYGYTTEVMGEDIDGVCKNWDDDD